MKFLHPEFLYLMLPAVMVLFYFLLTQREETARFFSEAIYEKLRVNTGMLTLQARNALFLTMFIFLILALAQPVFEAGKVKVQAKSADIMIALDISDSMLAEDVYPSRLERGKQKILELLALSPQERIGVSAFAKASYLVAPLSFDHRAVLFLVKQLQPSHITEKGTDFMQLLRASVQMMADNENKYLLIMTDGGDQTDFDKEIAFAKERGIKVFVLGIGTEQGAPIKTKTGDFVKQNGSIVVTRLNSAVAKLATETGGVYIESVTSNKDIRTMFAEISAKTKRRSLKEEEITRYNQLFYIPLGIGMVLLLMATSSMSRREKVHVPLSIACAVMVMQAPPLHAGLMDFTLLDNAKQAYESGDFNQSAKLYREYASRHRSNASLYNTASAQYKQGDFVKAAQNFEKVHFADKAKQFDTLHNLGNAYAKQGSTEGLSKAVEAYEKALAIKEEPPTRENLEAVQKLLKQQEKPPKDENRQNSDQKQQQNGDKQSQPEGEKSPESSGERDQKGQQNQQNRQKSDKPKDQDEQQGSSDTKQQDKQSKKPEQGKTEQQHKSAKPDANEKQAEGAASEAENIENAGMSDLEAQKWLKRLNDAPASHIYRIGPAENQQESDNEKPW